MTRVVIVSILLFKCLLSWGQSLPNTILWEISKPGIKHKSYLFGTFHEVNPDFFESLPNALKKLQNAQKVYLERLSPIGDTTGSHRLYTWNKERWNKILVSEQKQVFDAFVKKADDSVYYQFPPLVLLRSLSGMYYQNFCDTAGRESVEQMDQRIEQLATKNGQKVLALDTDQIDIFLKSTTVEYALLDSGYAQACIKFINAMLNDDNAGCQGIEDYKAFRNDYQFDTELSKVKLPSPLLLERNDKWIANLNKTLKEGNCFIAVGIGHLFYKEGLIVQLRNLGYKVEPISPR